MQANSETVAIIGVGLIGGSIGLGLRQRSLARRVIGVGRREETLREAMRCGAITEYSLDLASGISEADRMVVCTPVEQIAGYVMQCIEHGRPGALVMDAGSTKRAIVLQVRERVDALESQAATDSDGDTDCHSRPKFVGCHPMAGSEKTGVRHAHGDLLQGRVVVITPEETVSPQDIAAAESFWGALGARVMRLTAEQHDQMVASISHLPHAVASILAAATPESDLRLAASGWLDTTRIAAGDVELWRQILSQNRDCVLQSLEQFGKVLNSFTLALKQQDDAALTRLLALGKQRRDALAD